MKTVTDVNLSLIHILTEYENSKSDDQLEELLMLTEQMQEELDQKDRTIEKDVYKRQMPHASQFLQVFTW